MHTSTKLSSTDFAFRNTGQDGDVGLGGFLPDYEPTDRLAVVCGPVEDAVIHCAPALLAVTTGFYDVLRARHGADGFFNYPQHFAIIDVDEEGIRSRRGRVSLQQMSLGAPWGNLDVWPESQWIPSGGSATHMLEQVYRLHISRLFWPADLVPRPGDTAEQLPAHARRLLGARLRTVYLYGHAEPTVEVAYSKVVDDIVANSIRRLPDAAGDEAVADSGSSGYRREAVADFLERMASCFQSGAP